MRLVFLDIFVWHPPIPCQTFSRFSISFHSLRRQQALVAGHEPMKRGDDDLRIRPGRSRDGGTPGGKAKSFVAKVMRAASRAGHGGRRFSSVSVRQSSFGRGRAATARAALRSPSRRVLIKTRVARHRGSHFRAAPLSTHLTYLQRDGTNRDRSCWDSRAGRS